MANLIEVINLTSSDTDTNNDSDYSDCSSKNKEINLRTREKGTTDIDNVPVKTLQISPRKEQALYVHTTKLDDMTIFKKTLHVCIPQNILMQIEKESKPKVFRQSKIRRSDRKKNSIDRVRYNIAIINKFLTQKEEAIQGNYYDKLKMCRPVTVDLIYLKYCNINVKYCSNTTEVINTQQHDPASDEDSYKCYCSTKKTNDMYSKSNTHITLDIKNNLVKEIMKVDSSFNVPIRTHNLNIARTWCSYKMEQVKTTKAPKKLDSHINLMPNTITEMQKEDRTPTVTLIYKIRIAKNVSEECEFYLIKDNGDVLSYYIAKGTPAINKSEYMIVADIESLGLISYHCIYFTICCWYSRKKMVEICSLPSVVKGFLKSKHLCTFATCKCCCNPIRVKNCNSLSNASPSSYNHLVANKLPTATVDNSKRKRNEGYEHDYASTTDTDNSYQGVFQNTCYPILKKVKTVEDINREFDENCSLIKSKLMNNPENDAAANLACKDASKEKSDIIYEHCKDSNAILSNTAKNSLISPNSVNSEISTINILDNPEIQAVMRSILGQFKNVKLIISNDGRLAAHIDKTLDGNDLTPTDLQILVNIMTYAQDLIKTLKTSSISNHPGKSPSMSIVNTLHTAPESIDILKMYEKSSAIAKLKNTRYMSNLKCLLDKTPSLCQETTKKSNSKLNDSVTKSLENQDKSTGSYDGKTIQFQGTIVNATSRYSSNIPSSSLPQQNANKAQHNNNVHNFLKIVPMQTVSQQSQLQAVPVAVSTNYAQSVALPQLVPIRTGAVLNLASLANKVNVKPRQANKVPLPKNYMPLSVPTTNVKNVNWSNSSNSAQVSKTFVQTETTKQNNMEAVFDASCSRSQKENVTHSDQNTHHNEKTKITDNNESNIDWESRIISNSLMATNSDTTAQANELSEANLSGLPVITQVFSLSSQSVVSLIDSD